MNAAQITDPKTIAEFVYAGNATFTIVSKASGTRFTYRLARKKGDDGVDRPWFAGLLNGPDNENGYAYMAVVSQRARYALRFGHSSRVGQEAPSARLLTWFLRHLGAALAGAPTKLDQVEFWHEGRCGRCGRKLTVPESIANGIGPVCEAAE